MRKSVMIGCLVAAGCGGGQPRVDSAVASDSIIVSGPPAIPTTRATPLDSARPSPPPAAKPVASATPLTSTDSLRGIVSVTGTSFDKHIMITAAGGRRVEITGSLAPLIGHLAGAEVSVRGKADGRNFDASGFVVRSVDGQPAIDGVLKTEGGALYIVGGNGTRSRIASPPPPLVGRDGARVWITGDPSKGVSSFGFIDPPR